MSQKTEGSTSAQLVYCVMNYGRLVGVYANQKDAMDVVSINIAKGQICDLIVKPLIYSLNTP